jgi:hypothetical protein
MTGTIGLILVLASGGLLIIFSLRQGRKGVRQTAFRNIPAFLWLKKAIGRTVEDGNRIHVSLGNSSILDPSNASAMIGLSALRYILDTSIDSDLPPVASSGDGTISIMSQDALRAGYRARGALDRYRSFYGRMAGNTPLAYIAGSLPIAYDERVSTHIVLGNFGPEVAYLNDAAESTSAFVIAASDNLSAQAVIYATFREPLIGEELFATPAYLEEGRFHRASLITQDILRWLIIGFMLIGSLLTAVGLIR